MAIDDLDIRIIESIKALHAEGKPIFAYSVGMHAGLDNSIVSRWFRDHGIFYDHWKHSWVVIVPELAEDVVEKLPRGTIHRAEWLSTGWLRRGYSPKDPSARTR